MTKEEIAERIKVLKKEISERRGEPCQVYSRVVGYLRPVQAWNDGKATEFMMRKHTYSGNGDEAKKSANELHEKNMAVYSSVAKIRHGL